MAGAVQKTAFFAPAILLLPQKMISID